jgi:hypothetical protein
VCKLEAALDRSPTCGDRGAPSPSCAAASAGLSGNAQAKLLCRIPIGASTSACINSSSQCVFFHQVDERLKRGQRHAVPRKTNTREPRQGVLADGESVKPDDREVIWNRQPGLVADGAQRANGNSVAVRQNGVDPRVAVQQLHALFEAQIVVRPRLHAVALQFDDQLCVDGDAGRLQRRLVPEATALVARRR